MNNIILKLLQYSLTRYNLQYYLINLFQNHRHFTERGWKVRRRDGRRLSE